VNLVSGVPNRTAVAGGIVSVACIRHRVDSIVISASLDIGLEIVISTKAAFRYSLSVLKIYSYVYYTFLVLGYIQKHHLTTLGCLSIFIVHWT